MNCFSLALVGWSICLATAADTGHEHLVRELKAGAAQEGVVDPPISGTQRLKWFTDATVGPESLVAGVFSAGWGTARTIPPEYDAHWEGFAKRYGMRLTGVSVGNAIEGGLGAVWGEDPRYVRSGSGGLWGRVGHSLKLTVTARRRDGRYAPSYARYTGIVGNNFLSNTWRVPSASDTGDALTRSAFGVSGKFVGNLLAEFWPDVRRRIAAGDP